MEYYTKRFDLPGRFTAMNGAIQYFELKTKAPLKANAPVDPEHPTVAEAKAIAAAQANYLRVLEVLRSRGAQPVITHVDNVEGEEGVASVLGFTLEQTWVYGARGVMQVSEHYDDADPKKAFAGLSDGAIADIEEAFGADDHGFPVKALEAEGDTLESIKVVEKEGEGSELFVSVEVKTTAGSLNAND